MERLGPTSKKILLLLESGLLLALTNRPDVYFRIIKRTIKEWKNINERNLRETIKRLYQSKIIGCKEEKDGNVILTLTEAGKNRVLKYKIDEMKIKKPARWDGLWRTVIFDIPEDQKLGRKALAAKLKELGFYHLQKSVFIHPYECKDEIDFINELFNLTPYVRFLRVKDTDIDLDLRNYFKLR